MKKIIIGVLVIDVILLLGWFIWTDIGSQKQSSWLIKKHADPNASGILINPSNDWCGIIADADFAKLSEQQRSRYADKFFNDEVFGVAKETGYSTLQLKRWFENTAVNFHKYPIKEMRLSYGVQKYRDLRDSNFPEISYSLIATNLIRSIFSNKSTFLLFVLFILLTLIPLFILIGVFYYVLSKKIAFPLKGLIISLSIIIIGLVIWVVRQNKDIVRSPLGFYNFYDDANYGYVSVKGTWVSDAKLFPIQTTELDCFKDKMLCVEATASKFDEYVKVDVNYWDILDWGDDEIKVVDNDASVCCSNHLRIDRKNKTVTMISSLKQPVTADCEKLGAYPVVMYLTNYLDYKNKKR